ncbi:MAG: tRNA (guanosine(46)-N7)-methyltransferase TrmB [Gammaproteobacteria bacterium]|nr:tRNA (guanosine(46)-N7)-methyltransferase TrmB [Gammaproteobacteria bacterium]MCP5136527.1 tRNA (guanosine(46)-N7)-methyltransferase TrmB [Gammaproteobacteria bacterium]
MSDHPHREIRSFVKREGRLTPGQQRALDELFPQFGIAIDTATPRPLDLPAQFGRDAPVTLEIGFGNGEAMATMAAAAPELNFIGIEVHRPGVGHLLLKVEEIGLTNVRAINHDAVEVVRDFIPEQALDRVLVWFADPWPKKKHHKRRIIQLAFVELLRSRLKPGCILHLATDWQNYAEHQLEVMDAAPGWENAAGPGNYSAKPDYRPETKFERRGLKLGHGVWDLVYRRKD